MPDPLPPDPLSPEGSSPEPAPGPGHDAPSIDVVGGATPARRVGRPWIAALAALVFVAGTAVVVGNLAADDENGPEAAVSALLEAAAEGDVLGMLDQVAPGEREALREPLTDLVAELERIGILADVDLADLDLYTLAIADLGLDVERRRDDLAFVRITGGTATYSLDPADLPFGSVIRSLVGASLGGGSAKASGTTDLGSDDGEVGLVTIKRDGRWYVSIGYTIAEQARLEAGRTFDELGEGVTATGADSAEDAVRELVKAAAGMDLRRVLELLPPGEMGALQDYAGLFLPEAEAAAAANPLTVTIGRFELSSAVDGDTATVTIDELEAVASTPDGGTMTLQDGCVTLTPKDGPPQTTCGVDPTAALGGIPGLGIPGLGSSGLPGLGSFPGAGAEARIRAVKVDGRWYVSPVRTLLDGFVAHLAALDGNALAGMLPGLLGGLPGLVDRAGDGATRD